jgi:hypothetical protein
MKRSSFDAELDPRPQDRRHSVVPPERAPAPKISKARACEYALLPFVARNNPLCLRQLLNAHAICNTGAECKRHKIRCEFRPGDVSCTKCLRSGIKCVVNDFSQKFVDDDGV